MHHPIVFLHGSGDSARVWRLQQAYLAAHNYPAYAIDLPGHGQRPDTLLREVTILDYTRAAHTIIREELHLDHPIIAGHSLGGAVALSMALEYAQELGGLILIGTGARLRVLPALLEATLTTPEQARLQLAQLAVAPTNTGALSQQITDEQVVPAPYILHRDLAACNIFDIIPRLHEIVLPTLIICGAEDRMTPPKYSQFLHEQLLTSTLAIIPNAGHYVMREQPDAVNRAIEHWVQHKL